MSLHKHDCRATFEHLIFLSDRNYELCLSACLHHDSTWRRIDRGIDKSDCDQLKTVVAAGRRYRMSQSTTNQSNNGHPPKLTPQKVHYQHNLVFFLNQHKGYQWKSVQFLLQFRQTLYNMQPIFSIFLLFSTKLQKITFA